MGNYFSGRSCYSENWIRSFVLLSAMYITEGQVNKSTVPFQTMSPESSQVITPLNNTRNCTEWWENDGRSSPEDYPIVQYIIAILQIFVALVTIGGNLLVIIAVSTFHELQTITNMFVGSLAYADLIMGAFVMPIGIPYVATGRWGLGSLFCDFWISIDVLVVTASIETLCAIALDRYLAITKPFTYTANVTRSRARFLIAFIWITAASIAFIPVQLGWWKVMDSDEATCCYETDQCCEFMTNKMYAIVSSAISFYIPTALMIFSYALVFKEAIRLASQIDEQSGTIRRASMPGTNRPLWNREQRRTVFTFGYIMGIFTMCWLPFFIVNVAQAINPGCIPPSIFTSLNWLGYANSFFNPFIYSHNAQFRQAFLRLLTCLPCSEGFQRTKRASLSDSFPRYRNSGSRDSTLHAISSFFLAGGTSRKRSSRKSTGSMHLKRDSTISGGRSPNRSPMRQTRFVIGSEDNDTSIRMSKTDNNNDSDNEVFKRDTICMGTPTITINEHSDNFRRKSNFPSNGFHHSLISDPQNGEMKLSDNIKVIVNGTSKQKLENSPSSFHLSLEEQLSGQVELTRPLLDDETGSRCKNGRHQIRTRRTRSLFLTAPEGIYLRNPSSSDNSSTADMVVLSVGERAPLIASQPELSRSENNDAGSSTS